MDGYKNEMKTISFIYKFKSKLDHLVTNAFDKDVMFTQAIADTLEDLVQGREPAIAIAAAEYIDKKMKSEKLFQVSKQARAEWEGKRIFTMMHNRMQTTIPISLMHLTGLLQPFGHLQVISPWYACCIPVNDSSIFIDKDVFDGVYQRLLGSRLLSGASSIRAENLMVTKLQSSK